MKYALLLLTLLCALPAHAQQMSPEQARDIAARFFADHTTRNDAAPRQKARKDTAPRLAYTSQSAGEADYYVFQRDADGHGFVIVGAHEADQADAVIGYVSEGVFDMAQIPPSLIGYLDDYQRGGVSRRRYNAAQPWANIDPLIATKWNQGAPFNAAIPVLDTAGTPFFTGCVATATAQIMKYYHHPQQGSGSHTYTFAYDDSTNGYTIGDISVDFSTTHYDWDNMLDDYNAAYSDASAEAVATLMYHVGAAGSSCYGTDMTGGSDRLTATALYRNFGYDKSVQRAERKYYTDEAWARLVYSELAAQRPVLYIGASTEVGHAFVCDGYSDGLFHINWGWGGYCDGLFALFGSDALTPDGTGAGGGSAGQSYGGNQTIVYGIKPDEGGNFTAQPVCDGYLLSTTDGGTMTEHVTIDRSQPDADCTLYYTYRAYDAGIYGYMRYAKGIMLRNTATGECCYDHPTHWDNYLPMQTSILTADGTYEAYPAYTTDNGQTWHAMPYLVAGQRVPTITITGSKDDTTAAVSSPRAKTVDTQRAYDLSGRSMMASSKGISVIDSRKILL